MLISELVFKSYVHTVHYAIVCDRTPEWIRNFSINNVDCFIFPFWTKSVEEVPDCSDLFEIEGPIGKCHGIRNYDGTHVMQPWYVGNCHPIRVIIREIVDRTLKPAIDGGDVIVCDLDESVELPE